MKVEYTVNGNTRIVDIEQEPDFFTLWPGEYSVKITVLDCNDKNDKKETHENGTTT